MKKILAMLMCFCLLICASCGKKGEEKQIETDVNKVEQTVENLDKKIAQDPMSIDEEDISAAKETALEMEKELKDKIGKVKEEDVEQFQNRQVSVELLKQGLDALEQAKKSGDEQAVIAAQQQIEMAKSLWDFVQEQE